MRPMRTLALALALAFTGCASGSTAGSPATTVEPSPSTNTSLPAVGGVPEGCHLADLRTPDGDALDLSGIWVVDTTEGAVPAKWWLRSFGDCVWGTGIADAYTEDSFLSRAASVQTMRGTIRNDFTIDSTVILLGPSPSFASDRRFADVRWIIDVSPEGAITLREDRVPQVAGPRCPDPTGYCPAPLILRPQD